MITYSKIRLHLDASEALTQVMDFDKRTILEVIFDGIGFSKWSLKSVPCF